MRENILGNSNNSALVNSSEDGIDRRGFLECMAWAGTGVLWTVAGGILSSDTCPFRQCADAGRRLQLRAAQRQSYWL